MAKFNPYQVIADTLIASIEAGTPAWRCGWKKLGGALVRPVSGGSGKSYNGINVLLLWGSAQEQGFWSHEWHTYKGAKAKDGQVRKGEKGTKIVKWLFLPYKDAKTGKPQLDANGEPVTYAASTLRGHSLRSRTTTALRLATTSRTPRSSSTHGPPRLRFATAVTQRSIAQRKTTFSCHCSSSSRLRPSTSRPPSTRPYTARATSPG